MINYLRCLNQAVQKNNYSDMVKALELLQPKVQSPLADANSDLYLKLFRECLTQKHDDGSELWLEDVAQIGEIALAEIKEVERGIELLFVLV